MGGFIINSLVMDYLGHIQLFQRLVTNDKTTFRIPPKDIYIGMVFLVIGLLLPACITAGFWILIALYFNFGRLFLN